ncbi:MAG: HEAT repeat domain-containing protein [Spirochaetes bacterium]|nr:HEAT repeat domain-containing protein [Spirochaetota bacterium]
MKRNRGRIIPCILAAVVAGPFGLYRPVPAAAQADCPMEVSGLIGALLAEKNEQKKRELVKKLREYPADDIASCWLERLEDAGRVSTRVRVIDQMSEYEERRFVMPLANYLISSHSPVRKSAARALKKIGDDRLFPVILNMVNSDNPVHRIYFIEAMNYLYDHRFYQSLTNLLKEENKSIRIYVLNCLKENRIVRSLGLIRGAALGDKNDEVRVAAIEALGALRDVGGLGTMHMTLNDKNRDVRRESARSIRLIGSVVSVNTLSQRLMYEDDSEIKEIMIETLASLRRAGDVRGLEKIMLADDNLGLRVKSAYVLGFSGTFKALDALVRGSGDHDFRVRAEVCNSLGNYRNRRALAALFEVLEKDDQVYVKSAALYAIKRINDRTSLMGLFDLFAREQDPVFREMLRDTIRKYIKRFI